MTFPIAMARDDFTDNVISPMWIESDAGSATGAETGGQAVFTLPSSVAGTHDARYTSTALYNLTGDSCYIGVGTMVATGVAATAYFVLLAGADAYQWVQTSGTLKAQKIVAGVTTDLYSVAWSLSTYQYLRIRESAGTVYFDSSTTASGGASWTNRGNSPIASAFAVTALKIIYGAVCGNVASPGSFRLDMFNTVLPVPTATWRETTADWQIEDRRGGVTLASDGGKVGVLVTADTMDSARALGGTVRYFAGPLGSASGGYLAMTEYASLALAQASAFHVPINGRMDFPAPIVSRFVRLYHRSVDGSSHTIREFVPRRLVQADDIEAESITAINIAAHTITAQQIATVNLDATARITAGAGVVTLDDTGISIRIDPATPDLSDVNAYTFRQPDGTSIGGMYATNPTGAQVVHVFSGGDLGSNATIIIEAVALTGTFGHIDLLATGPGAGVQAAIRMNATGSATIGIDGGAGNVTVSVTGQIVTSGNVGFGLNIQSNMRCYINGIGTTSANYALYVDNHSGGKLLTIKDNGDILQGAAGGAQGFYGSAGAVKPTVTGSRGANAALASLLTGLASLGLLTDSST